MSNVRAHNAGINLPGLKRKGGRLVYWLFRTAFIVGICFMIIYPLLTKVSMSFMRQEDLYDRTVQSIPKNFTWMNYPEAINFMRYWITCFSTFIICGLSGVLQSFSCSMVGYGLARFEFKGKKLAFALVMVMMVIPPQLILTPLYLNFQNFDPLGIVSAINGGKGLRLIESVLPFILLAASATGPRCGLYIFLARQFFRGFPKVIDEAATIDGASHKRVFFTIMLPTAVPIMVTIFLFSFVWLWNDNMYAFLFYSQSPTMAKALLALEGQFSAIHVTSSAGASDIGYFSIMQSTGVLLAIIPLLILYAFLQKIFIQSIERTGIVG